jgi:hypothetical protein
MRFLATLAVAAIALAGCGTTRISETFDSRANAGPCPATGSIYDAVRYVKFAPGGKELYSDIEFTGEITDVRLFCRYAGGDPLVASMEIDFAFGKGEKAAGSTHSYPYFVAVTRRGGKVLAKQTFNVTAEFGRGRVAGRTENISRIEIPRLDESISGVNFEILVGYDLTAEQLQFNRDGKRFRLDAEQK